MAGTSISAHIDQTLAEQVSRLGKRDSRTTSQVVGNALRLYVALHPQTRSSLMALDNLGTPEEVDWVLREMARVINKAEFAMNKRLMAEEMGGQWPEDAREGTGEGPRP